MQKRRPLRKLTLTRETLRGLERNLSRAAGGGPWTEVSVCYICAVSDLITECVRDCESFVPSCWGETCISVCPENC